VSTAAGPEGAPAQGPGHKLLQHPAIRAGVLFVDFFLIILAFYQVKPASRSLFLDHANAASLPYLWVASAVLLLLLMPVYQRLVARYRRVDVVLGTCALVIVLLIVFSLFLLQQPGLATAVAFYLLVDLLSVVLVEQFWSLTNSVYRSADGQRWYGLIASGGVVGGMLGGLLAAALVVVSPLTTTDLPLVAAGLLALMMVLTLWLGRNGLYDQAPKPTAEAARDAAALWSALRGNRYLLLIALMLLLSQIAEPIVEYQLMNLVERTYSEREARTAFLSGFYSLLSAVALGVNLLLVPLVYRHGGMLAALLVQPLLLAAGALLFSVNVQMWTAGLMKILDRGLSYSINRTARELLYVRIDPSTIFRAKAWIDMVGYRAFKIPGSLLILLLTQWLPWGSVGLAQLSWVVIGLCMVWVVVAVFIAARLLPATGVPLPAHPLTGRIPGREP
jgi:ATP:ADP antiporter, AAA family